MQNCDTPLAKYQEIYLSFWGHYDVAMQGMQEIILTQV
jgi:hypothetical protein